MDKIWNSKSFSVYLDMIYVLLLFNLLKLKQKKNKHYFITEIRTTIERAGDSFEHYSFNSVTFVNILVILCASNI